MNIVILAKEKGFISKSEEGLDYYLFLCEVQRWLREEYFLYVEVNRSHFDGFLGIVVFNCHVVDIKIDYVKGQKNIIRTKDHKLTFNSYEEALEQGLSAALKLIKQ